MRNRTTGKHDMFQRRTFLQGTGAIIALPFLESLLPRAARAAALSSPPTRLISYFVPLGMRADAWLPKKTGANYDLTPTLQPLADYVNDFTVVSNTDGKIDNQPKGNGGGAHAIGCAMYPTATRISPPGSANLAMSFDQVVAKSFGNVTGRLQSLQLGVIDDSKYADGFEDTNYLHCISWASPTSPQPAHLSPTTAFNALFPAGVVTGQQANAVTRVAIRASTPATLQKSILDAAIAQTASLKVRLGSADRQILDQYLTNLRAVERNLVFDTAAPASTGEVPTGNGSGTTVQPGSSPASAAACRVPGAPSKTGDRDYVTRIAQLTALMPLALACDRTRVIAFAFGRGMCDRRYSHLGISAQHHKISHVTGPDSSGLPAAENIALLKKIEAYETKCFADLLGGLRAIPEGSGTLLDNTVLFFSSEMSNSQAHTANDMPVLIAGGGGGRLKARGQHIRAANGTKYAQALLTAVRATGVTLDKFGTYNVTDTIPGML